MMNWAQTFTDGRRTKVSAVTLGYLEATFVLAPMEPLFIPMMLSQSHRSPIGAWKVAAFLLIGNLLGALSLYAVGLWLAEPLILPLIEMLDLNEAYEKALQRFKSSGFAALFLVSVTPFPFQAGVAAAGTVGFSLGLFSLAVALGRGLRYFGLALGVNALGDGVSDILKKYEPHMFIAGLGIFAAFCSYLILA